MDKNNEKANRQARSDPKVNYALDKERNAKLATDAYDNKLKGLGKFRATILSIEKRILFTESAGKRISTFVASDKAANFFEVRVRPEFYDQQPAPWDYSDYKVTATGVTYPENGDAATCIQSHPLARSETPTNIGASIFLNVGDVVLCTTGRGPNESGKLRDLRFSLNTTGRDEELVALGATSAINAFQGGGTSASPPSPSSNSNNPNAGNVAYDGAVDPSTLSWSGTDRGKKNKDGTPRVETGKPSGPTVYIGSVAKYNGMKVYNGSLPKEMLVRHKSDFGEYDAKTHALVKTANFSMRVIADVLPSLQRLDAAFKQEFGHGIRAGSSYRTWAGQVSVVGPMSAVPGNSRHGWGLAVDFSVGKTPDAKKKLYSNTGKAGWEHMYFIWLRANGPKFGWIHPYWAAPPLYGGTLPEPWHFEYQKRGEFFKGQKDAYSWNKTVFGKISKGERLGYKTFDSKLRDDKVIAAIKSKSKKTKFKFEGKTIADLKEVTPIPAYNFDPTTGVPL